MRKSTGSRFSAILLASVAVSASLYAREAHADEEWFKIYNHVTPAAMCQPVDAADAEKLDLFYGAWLFESGATGTAYLTCAIPFPLTNGSWSDVDPLVFPQGKYWYRDSTGTSTSASVRVDIMRRYDHGTSVTQLLRSFDSNWFTDTGNTYHWGDDGLVVDPDDGGFVFLRVRMYRASASDTVVFGGVHWISPPPV